MNLTRTYFLIQLLIVAALCAPIVARAQEEPTGPPPDESVASSTAFQRSGIFGCGAAEYTLGSVGAFAAIGGVYVPTNDAAVTLNSGSVVYKECVLDGVSKSIARNAATDLVAKGLNDFLTGRNGKPLWPEDLIAEILERADQTILHVLESGELNALNPALREGVIRAVAVNYKNSTRNSNQMLECPYDGDLKSVFDNNTSDIWGGLLTFTNPACNPLTANLLTQYYVNKEIARNQAEREFQLSTGQGTYSVQEYDDATGRYITKTPGSVVAANIQQIITSGFRHLENVTEIDQMVESLFSGLSTQAISDTQGLKGLLASNLGQPSYLEQMVREVARSVRENATNAALTVLNASRVVETRFLNAMKAMATRFTDTIATLRAAENQCWNLVIENVCATALSVSNTCTSVPPGPCSTNQGTGTQICPTGVLLQVATTTARSQQVIDSQIAPLAEIVAENLGKSEQALEKINRLIAGVTNTTSLEAQRLALLQLDGLVAQKLLHNQYEAEEAEKQQTSVNAQMTSLAEDTVTAWGDSTDIETGWCNVNNFGVIEKWIDTWRNTGI